MFSIPYISYAMLLADHLFLGNRNESIVLGRFIILARQCEYTFIGYVFLLLFCKCVFVYVTVI